MLKEFWKRNKGVLQLSAILIGISALFLNIPPPNGSQAKAALANIQLVSLLLITVGLSAIFYHIWKLIVEIERAAKEKYKINFTETISLLFMGIATWFLLNLWVYIGAVYQQAISKTIEGISFALGIMVSVISALIVLKLRGRVRGWLLVLLKTLICSSLISLVPWATMNPRFSVNVWATWTLGVFLLFLTINTGIGLWHKFKAWKKARPVPWVNVVEKK